MNMDKLMQELMDDEGCVYEIYEDHLGYATFGIGHLITEKDEEYGKPVGTPVSEERVEECFNQDIKIVCEELDMKEPWWRNLDDTRQRVMANMCFNLGHPRLSNFKRFLAAMHTAQWETAAVEMMDSKWSSQVGDRALRLRDKVLRGDD
jgi:lysozyme|tara:strand:+ start:507 stop:953 length:447 start_codon:yes stop_codon:yes gene_type:complete